MAVEGKYETLTVTAGADLTDQIFKAITLAGTVATTTLAAEGILRTKSRDGQHATLAYAGRMKAYAGAAVNSGAQLGVTAGGYLITVTGSAYCGVALASASSGALVPFTGNFQMGRVA